MRVALVVAALTRVASAAGSAPTVETSAELSTYADSDNTTVVTPTARLGVRDDTAGYRVGGRYLVDVVSTASVDIVATASRRWTEVRHAGSVDGQYGPGDFKIGGSGSVSVEPDYLSLSAGVQPSLSVDEDHVTLVAGYSFGHDTIGRAGTPFDVFHRTLMRHGLSAGATFVLSPSALFGVGADVILERGDQSKPYRWVPMFDASVAPTVPVGASVDRVNALRRSERPLEKLPLSRERYALTGRFLHRSSWATLRAEERVYVDSWGQPASTTDLRWAMDVSPRITLAPSLRFHVQGAASFWERAYAVGGTEARPVLPNIRTGDRELGPLWAGTLGLDVRFALTSLQALSRLALVMRVAGIHTTFLDALFIENRNAIFSALAFEGQFDRE